MDKKSLIVRLLTFSSWGVILLLTAINSIKIITHQSIGFFGYLSCIFNVLALLAVCIDFGKQRRARNTQKLHNKETL